VSIAKPPEGREEVRASALAEIPGWYSPLAHLALPALFGIAVISYCIHTIHHLRLLELITVPLAFLLANALEWRAHKELLHHRTRFAEVLYDRHTPIHHRIYTTENMAMRDRREFRLVLLPAFGIGAILFTLLPLVAALLAMQLPNVAALLMVTSTAYVLLYEWLHLCYHLPQGHVLARGRIILRLRRHHATHHDPRLMQRYNMNVTIPIWDFVQGTVYKGPPCD
jgi:hypothetical protein